MTDISDRVRIESTKTLSDDHYILKKVEFAWRRADGEWQNTAREVYDCGDGCTILLFHRDTRSVILTRQFRYPAYVNDHPGVLIEVCAGLMDERDPLTAITREAAEETGYQVPNAVKVFEAFMSPGSVTEKLHFFVAEYDPEDRIGAGGGLEAEGEDIEVLELTLDEALAQVADGRIRDGKTIMLLQHAALHLMPR